MKNKSLWIPLLAVVAASLVVSVVAQAPTTMSAPIVRAAEGKVIFTVRVDNLAAGNKYRLGIGFPTSAAPEAGLELSAEDSPVNLSPSAFTQDNTGDWWGVPKLASRGYQLEGSALPEPGKQLTFRISLAKDAVAEFDKVFIFVSQDYGSNTWYLIDGSELDKSYW